MVGPSNGVKHMDNKFEKTKGTIVMIHGMWGWPGYWGKYRRFFGEKGFTCITPTLPYHDVDPNDPPHPKLGNISIADYVADVKRQIEQENLEEKPILIGHSVGGLISMLLASQGVAKTVVALAPAPPRGIMPLTFFGRQSKFGLRTTTYWGWWKEPQRLTSEEAKIMMFNLLPPEEQEEVCKNLRWDSGRATFEIGMSLFDRRKATKVDREKISCPMLIVAGQKDQCVPLSALRKTAKKFGKVADYWELENHGHWLMAEPGWEKLAQDIYQWLGEKL
ncbi:MAG: alpha/beta hydrolase [Candidatus Nealsonbacteria bacterium CG_4_10_14_0_2_um_filter_38_17]|uniref:Alpha/beta hydrolase n=2 Tax=Candidatus Nealsoniibacteriota TaxID=1817911 RepID=A0A2M7UYP6_9BACT|nr:MAG: alpha/beta hydrolase [Candidatus Nealsonbacteria bacterium CG23_combo_of_CG06-09_8_20_14_all_38_19]PIZ89104.1 MAG: alpha/beta hydrolase [Candidatus Nealsonbacteria bacterium CG_4_10_14_0_2_um_filter_38_17]